MTAEPVVVPDAAGAAAAARRLVRQGWRRVELEQLPPQPWELGPSRLFCGFDVSDSGRAKAAMLAAVRGVRLLVIASDGDAVEHAGFLDDLTRLAPPAPGRGPDPAADRDGLLGLLADGMTVTAAAEAMHVSRRTANRWLSQALTEYGVDSTAAAVRAWAARSQP